MTDREKVLKGLECCLVFDEDWFYHCDECPYRATEDERKVIDWCCHLEELRRDALELLKAQEPQTVGGTYNNHEVACIIADILGDACACNWNNNDEWLPNHCEFRDTVCPEPVGVACWEQYLTHLYKRPKEVKQNGAKSERAKRGNRGFRSRRGR